MVVREVTGYNLDSPCSNHGEVFGLFIYLFMYILFIFLFPPHRNAETFVGSSSFYFAGLVALLKFQRKLLFETFKCLCNQSS